MTEPRHATIWRHSDGIERCVICKSTTDEIRQGAACRCLSESTAGGGGEFCFLRKGHDGPCKRSIVGG